jgi:hypothetical protein
MYLQYRGDRVILCAMARGHAPQIVRGINNTDCPSVSLIQVKNPFQTFEHAVEATQDLVPLALGLKGKHHPENGGGTCS